MSRRVTRGTGSSTAAKGKSYRVVKLARCGMAVPSQEKEEGKRRGKKYTTGWKEGGDEGKEEEEEGQIIVT